MMLCLFLYFVCFYSGNYIVNALNCTSAADTPYSCSRDVILVLDSTSYMRNCDNIRTQFDFVEGYVLPQLDIQDNFVKVGSTLYGSGSTTMNLYKTKRSEVCADLEALYKNAQILPDGKDVPLSKTINNIFVIYEGFESTSLVLFTASENQTDINLAGDTLRKYADTPGFAIVVVNYGNSSFANFPQQITEVYAVGNVTDIDLGKYIDKTICDPKYTAPPVISTTAAMGTTQQPAQTTQAGAQTTTHGGGGFSPLPIGGNYSGCACNHSTIWLDIFVLMDSSIAMTKGGMDEAEDYILSVFSQLTLGQAEQYQTRLGAISYAEQVKLINNLNYYQTTDDFMNNFHFQYLGEMGTNIEGAIQMAVANFGNTQQHRAAAKKVIIIVASSYSAGDYEDPTQAAETFKNDGGVLITVSYDQTHGVPEQILQKLASPNYHLNNSVDMHADDLRWLLCEANCFCQKNMKPYKLDPWAAPQGGCHNPVSISSINRLAEHDCFTQWNEGFITFVEDQDKQNFLGGLIASKSKYWIGLQYINGQWMWPSALGEARYSVNFQSWGTGQPDLSKGNCTYMYQASGFGYSWFTDECIYDYNYICQTSPCHSMKYCAYSP